MSTETETENKLIEPHILELFLDYADGLTNAIQGHRGDLPSLAETLRRRMTTFKKRVTLIENQHLNRVTPLEDFTHDDFD